MKTADLTIVETRGGFAERAAQLGQAVRTNYAVTVALFDNRRALRASARDNRDSRTW